MKSPARVAHRLVAVVCAVTLSGVLSVALAFADDLSDQKAQADNAANQAQAAVNQDSAALAAANERVRGAQAQVDAAQAALDAAQAAWDQALANEAQKAIELWNANQALAAAQQKVEEGKAKIAAQQSAINAYARSILQDGGPLVNVAMFLQGGSTATVSNRMQWNDTVLDANQYDLDALRVIQQELVEAEAACTAAQIAAEQAKKDAEAQTAAAEAAQREAADAAASLSAALAVQQAAQQAAINLLAGDQAALAAAQAQQDSINAAIAEQARQEAARQAAIDAQNSGGGMPPDPGGDGQLSPSDAQSVAYGMIQSYGWGDGQFSCLVKLWTQESSWRWWAENPDSGAYGIPQSLPASKMASAGADYRTNAITQMRWGLSYISGRYGTPCAAWDHETSYWWY